MQIIHAHVDKDLSMNHNEIADDVLTDDMIADIIVPCDACGEKVHVNSLCDFTDDEDLGMICTECASMFVRCDDCNSILNPSYDIVRAPHSEFDDAFAVCEACYDERDAAITGGADIHNPRNLAIRRRRCKNGSMNLERA